MSYTFKYYPDPGITYDIIRMLYVKLNANNIWRETLTSIDYQDQHIKYIEEHAAFLPAPDPDLSLFLFIPSNKHCTYLSTVVETLLSKDFTQYSLDSLLEYLNQTSKVIDDVFSFYLGNLNINSREFEFQLRLSRILPDKIKLLLFGFKHNPDSFITKLILSIQNYFSIINEKFPIPFIPIENIDKYATQLFKKQRPHIPELDITIEIPYSLCSCTPIMSLVGYSHENLFFISTSGSINEKMNSEVTFTNSELLQLIHALDDQYRLDIIRLLKVNPEISPQDIAESLRLSVTAVKYHLSILKKANYIAFKRNNRSTEYTYNPTGYKMLIKALDNFEKGGLIS